jgi:hypothetical protein
VKTLRSPAAVIIATSLATAFVVAVALGANPLAALLLLLFAALSIRAWFWLGGRFLK